jgi:feruloyl-CoA synthase
VITGHDRAEACALIFLSAQARELSDAALRQRIAQVLADLRRDGGGSSQWVARALMLADAPSADAGEITDKGYINQRAVLQRRAADVQALYDAPYDVRVIIP